MNVAIFSTFSAVPPGGIASPQSSSTFVNYHDHPVFVEDIVFDWDWTVPARASSLTYGTPLGDAIRCKILYGNHPLTAGFVPVNLLGQFDSARANTPAIGVKAVALHSTFVWRFPAPLWLPPNMPLSIQMQHQNDFVVDTAAASQDIDVTVRGYLDDTDTIPDAIDIPYAAMFLTPVRSTVSGGKTGLTLITDQSGQTDLFNPFEQPLNVERMQYEISVSSTGKDGATRANFAPTDATSAQDQSGALTIGQNYGLDRRYVTLKVVSGSGLAVIRNYLPIGTVLSATTRRWEMRAVLDPGGYYSAFLQSQMPLFTDGATLPFQMRTGLAIVGSRRLTLAESLVTY